MTPTSSRASSRLPSSTSSERILPFPSAETMISVASNTPVASNSFSVWQAVSTAIPANNPILMFIRR